MRRLVETIESQAFGTTVYVVAEPEFPHEVHGLDTAVSERLAARLHSHPTARLYGPFRCSRKDGVPAPHHHGGVEAKAPPIVWVHYDPSTWQQISGSTGLAGAKVLAQLAARGQALTPDMVADQLAISEEDAGEVDTIIIGQAAVRKFVVPYLVQVYGLEEAMRRVAG
jgi:hypothetical protein